MSEYTYNFTIDQFPNEKYDLSKLDREIRDSSITVSLSHMVGSEEDIDIIFRNPLLGKDLTTLSGVVQIHDGEDDYIDYDPVKIVDVDSAATVNTELSSLPVDPSGKLRVHQTSRKIGTKICWSGRGDDTTDITKVGGGETLYFHHELGESSPMIKYIDFNMSENETWLHEGYMTWKDCIADTLSMQIVPRTVTVSGVVGGDKTVYGGYMVIPTASGSGNIEVVNDLTQPHGGLVYMPDSDIGETPTAYWDADWNSTTKEYENIRPNYTGTGRYNIFSYEVIFAEFVRELPLLSSGFIALSSSDTELIGQGFRIKLIADTNDSVDDHEWHVACILCMHREKTV
jgi:hypothetical protein